MSTLFKGVHYSRGHTINLPKFPIIKGIQEIALLTRIVKSIMSAESIKSMRSMKCIR